MFIFLGTELESYYGPFRLLTSHMLLLFLGAIGAFIMTWRILPSCFQWLPRDRGRAYAIKSKDAWGKPTGSGVIFVSLSLAIVICVMPVDPIHYVLLGLTCLNMIAGFLDDASQNPWGAYKKGGIDLVLAGIAACVLVWDGVPPIWLPVTKTVYAISAPWYIMIATIIIWGSINTTNCSDGVDGLSGTMVSVAGMFLAGLLYGIIGHRDVAFYLGIPYSPTAASWAICVLTFVGGVCGYLWHNALPSTVLMGDAGSRALGFLLGVTVMKTGNPFVLLVTIGLLWINGGTGLLKIAFLRFFHIHLFRNIRCPLHDYFRQVKGWSNTQVLLRFVIAQIMLSGTLLVALLKVR
jgi:phospho-N-acetylmuramoyl-pentapeptide-transferase